MSEKYSVNEMADIIDAEGLDYAIMHYCSADKIADPKLAKLWKKANKSLEDITDIFNEVIGMSFIKSLK